MATADRYTLDALDAAKILRDIQAIEYGLHRIDWGRSDAPASMVATCERLITSTRIALRLLADRDAAIASLTAEVGRLRGVEVVPVDGVPVGWEPSPRWHASSKRKTLVPGRDPDGHPVAWAQPGQWWTGTDKKSHRCTGLRHGQYLAEQALAGASND